MRTKIFLAGVIISIAFLIASCKKQAEPQAADFNFTNLGISLEALQITELPLELFRYRDSIELREHLNTTFQEFLSEVDDLAASDERIDHVIYDIDYTNSNAVLRSIYFLDLDEREVIDILEIGSTSENIDWGEIFELMYGKCKEGWTSQGSCSSKSCIAEKLQRYSVAV